MFLRRDARRRALHADRAATQAHLAADLLVDEGLTARQGRHAELEASALDATEELALARRPDALGTVGVQRQVAAEAPVDEDQVRPARRDDRGESATAGARVIIVFCAGVGSSTTWTMIVASDSVPID